jgi:hypothetical protein
MLTLTGYPLAMVHAEKIVTAVQRSIASTRWRDFADLYLLSGRHPVAGAELRRAIEEVASYRKVDLAPLAQALLGFPDRTQNRWDAWRRKQKLDDRLPASFAEVLAVVMAFADPVLDGAIEGKNWNPARRVWE